MRFFTGHLTNTARAVSQVETLNYYRRPTDPGSLKSPLVERQPGPGIVSHTSIHIDPPAQHKPRAACLGAMLIALFPDSITGTIRVFRSVDPMRRIAPGYLLDSNDSDPTFRTRQARRHHDQYQFRFSDSHDTGFSEEARRHHDQYQPRRTP